MKHENWNGFKKGVWLDEINVRDFIQNNYTPYEGDGSFLAGATPRTDALMKKIQSLFCNSAYSEFTSCEIITNFQQLVFFGYCSLNIKNIKFYLTLL